MININILTNNLAANSRAFNFPLIRYKHVLFSNKYNIKLYYNDSFILNKNKLYNRFLDCDILGINSKSMHYIWNNNRDYLFEFLSKAKNMGKKILWFDTYDSTSSTEFEVLQYVDLYLKNQLLKDKSLYLDERSRTRFYINYLNEHYNINQKPVEKWPLANKNSLSKIQLSWNSCFENYNKSRYSIFNRFNHKYLRPNRLWPQKNRIKFSPVDSIRENICSYRGNTDYQWTALIRHREEISRLIRKIGVKSGKVNLDVFFSEMENSITSIGPFGLGEITLRDYEIIISGSTLIKPDISYLQTWPNLFKENKTYIPIKWDLSNLLDTIESLRVNLDYRIHVAENAQRVYKKYIFDESQDSLFIEQFDGIINKLDK